jgi:hypothetical protein
MDRFKGIGRCNIGDGKSALFWTDLWSDNCLIQEYPHLVTFAKKRDLNVHEVINTEFLDDLFYLPLSQEAYNEFQEMETLCTQTKERKQSQNKDEWSYIWGNNVFTVKKAYKALIGYQPAPPHFNWVWKSSCQARHKFFFWLLIHDRLNTRNLLGRKQMQLQSYNCATLECQQEETLLHLFWECPFTVKCWDYVCPRRIQGLNTLDSISNIKTQINLPFSMEIIILAAWSIWILRNEKIFNNIQPLFRSWKAIYFQELRWLGFRIKKNMKIHLRIGFNPCPRICTYLGSSLSSSFFILGILPFVNSLYLALSDI